MKNDFMSIIKVLIVEDNENDLELLQHELKKSKLNFSSKIAQDQPEFISCLDNFEPDIILSDYSLPSFDGVSAFNIKQNRQPDIPFIIVSGTIGEENAVELIKNGVTDYVLKDKLFALNTKIIRALKDAEEIKEKRKNDEILRYQNEKLFEIAFLQSHQVRGPVAQILGLFSLFDFDNPSAEQNIEVFHKLKMVADSLDNTIHLIVEKTNEIKMEK